MPKTAIGHGYPPEQIERAKRAIYRAETWRKDNADAYHAIVVHAQDLASRGETVSTRDYLNVVHSKAYLDRFGNDATINADYCPVIARWLWCEYPELRESIELRRCPVGEVMGL